MHQVSFNFFTWFLAAALASCIGVCTHPRVRVHALAWLPGHPPLGTMEEPLG